MSRHGDVTLAWGDGNGPGPNGEYTFRLHVREWDRIDELFDVGPYELFRRLNLGTWKRKYLSEVMRIALQGGGSVVTNGAVDDLRINALVDEYVNNRPFVTTAIFLVGMLSAILFEPEADPIPKSAAAEEMPQSFQTESSPSPPSTDGVLPSDTPPQKLARSRSGNSGRRKRASSSPTVEPKSSPLPPLMNSTP